MELEEGFLGEVFGLSHISHHSQAQGVDAALVEGVELGEGVMIASLSASQHICVGPGRRLRDNFSWGSGFNLSGMGCFRGLHLNWRTARRRHSSRASVMRVHGHPDWRHSFPCRMEREAAECCATHDSSLV